MQWVGGGRRNSYRKEEKIRFAAIAVAYNKVGRNRQRILSAGIVTARKKKSDVRR